MTENVVVGLVSGGIALCLLICVIVHGIKRGKKPFNNDVDWNDRKVYLVETEFETVLGEKVVHTSRWVRLNALLDGLKSYRELFLIRGSINVDGKIYSGKHIVSAESKIVGEAYVKESVKREMGGYGWDSWSYWEMSRYHDEDEIERVRKNV